jgi:hypothetical protein
MLPPRGVRWLRRGKDGSWERIEPPADWGMPEEWDDAPPLADNFFLTAPEAAWSSVEDRPWQHGTLRNEPDLYAKIASSNVSPALILSCANRYGFLGPKADQWPIEKMLWPEYTYEPGFALTQDSFFWAEPASNWINVLGWLSTAINRLGKIGSESKRQRLAFLNWYNMHAERSLDYRLEWDTANSKLKGEVVGSSLADLLMVQLGSALDADIDHRRCEECQTFFPVHPGLGRPEKKYCSDACRMRAYRRRSQPVT